jgi:hypothetical protein
VEGRRDSLYEKKWQTEKCNFRFSNNSHGGDYSTEITKKKILYTMAYFIQNSYKLHAEQC